MSSAAEACCAAALLLAVICCLSLHAAALDDNSQLQTEVRKLTPYAMCVKLRPGVGCVNVKQICTIQTVS